MNNYIRKSFNRIDSPILVTNFISFQKESFETFLQYSIPDNQRKNIGLLKLFNSFFPVVDSQNKAQLEFQGYSFDEPRFTVSECKYRGDTYSAAIKGRFRLIVWNVDEKTGVKTIKSVKEQEVYLGNMPLMTDNGTFIFNGIERVVVSQIHRSPGVFISHDHGKGHISGKLLFSARVIPDHGAWIDIEFDHNDLLYISFDRKRKCPIGTFLMCLYSKETEDYLKKAKKIDKTRLYGMSKDEILNTFYESVSYKKAKTGWVVPFLRKQLLGTRITFDLVDYETKKIYAKSGEKINYKIISQMEKQNVKSILIPEDGILGKFLAQDILNLRTGEIYCEAGTAITQEILDKILSGENYELKILVVDNVDIGTFILNSLSSTTCVNRDEALCEFYRRLIPGETPTVAMSEELFTNMLFNSERYDISEIGRVKINDRLGIKDSDSRTLQKKDIIEIIRLLCLVKNEKQSTDDIDDLGNRRIRKVGELIANQCRMGMARLTRNIKEKMGVLELDNHVPSDLINAKTLIASVNDFFVSSQLSQFMDQTNPLSELTHKRRLSALGQGGLTRDRAGFEVRDVHWSHYSRLCPIETPEGQNIGLITSLASHAKINRYGFLEAPYKKVVDGKVTDTIDYLTASEENKFVIASSNQKICKDGSIKDDSVICRHAGNIEYHNKSKVDYIDVSPQQVVSVAAALIPFLETDDASRALMGANMQRQAVPLLHPEAPLVGTGMESYAIKDLPALIKAKRSGVVAKVDARRIIVSVQDAENPTDTYLLSKFQASNMNTCINQKPLVNVGDKINAGDALACGPAADKNELALGRNLLVAFLSWDGYSYEDSIILSERIVKEDILTSVHIESFEVTARDTKLGNEEFTRDLPNISDKSLRNLDETGLIYVGAEVDPGDILVGKVTPKAEVNSSPEEKLLRAIFGEKSTDVRDSSFRVPPGVSGTVVDLRISLRKGVRPDSRAITIDRVKTEEFGKDRDDEIDIFKNAYKKILCEKLENQIAISEGREYILTPEILNNTHLEKLQKLKLKDKNLQIVLSDIFKQLDISLKKVQEKFENNLRKLREGYELSSGVLKVVKIFIAQKRKIQPGDKMAGRHGNKGVISKILPIEDMPFLKDGTPIDILLNPLGLPSRMNLGQILETHLGFAAYTLGRQLQIIVEKYRQDKLKITDIRNKIDDIYDRPMTKNMSDREVEEFASSLSNGVPVATPVFDGASIKDIETMLVKAGLDSSGQVTLYDGRTGTPFDRKVTVGYKYMLKLHHLVDDKLHARSVGPYSLITQQPLGGKAQFGGQRFGEMEVWALEAYGAAYTLLEMLTVKSDDVSGRTKMYNNIIKGDNITTLYGFPESWNVLVKELKALGLNIEFEKNEPGDVELIEEEK